MSRWKAAYDRMCAGTDNTCNAIVARLVSAGWAPDRILKNVVTRIYGPNQAVLRVHIDVKSNRYWLDGEYVSEGQNALEACHEGFDPLPSSSALETRLSAFLTEVERNIQGTFAMRFLA